MACQHRGPRTRSSCFTPAIRTRLSAKRPARIPEQLVERGAQRGGGPHLVAAMGSLRMLPRACNRYFRSKYALKTRLNSLPEVTAAPALLTRSPPPLLPSAVTSPLQVCQRARRRVDQRSGGAAEDHGAAPAQDVWSGGGGSGDVGGTGRGDAAPTPPSCSLSVLRRRFSPPSRFRT